MRMNVIIYLIFAGSLPPPLSVLQVNQYSRPRSESSPSSSAHPHPRSHTYHPAASVIPRVFSLYLSPSFPLSLSLSFPFLLFLSFSFLSSTLKVHRHYFRRNRHTSIRRVRERRFSQNKKQQRLLRIEENPQ